MFQINMDHFVPKPSTTGQSSVGQALVPYSTSPDHQERSQISPVSDVTTGSEVMPRSEVVGRPEVTPGSEVLLGSDKDKRTEEEKVPGKRVTSRSTNKSQGCVIPPNHLEENYFFKKP